MSAKQDLTVSLDEETIRRAKTLAAQRGATISQLLAIYIADMAEQSSTYEVAQSRALSFLERGFHLGGQAPVSRDEWHER